MSSAALAAPAFSVSSRRLEASSQSFSASSVSYEAIPAPIGGMAAENAASAAALAHRGSGRPRWRLLSSMTTRLLSAMGTICNKTNSNISLAISVLGDRLSTLTYMSCLSSNSGSLLSRRHTTPVKRLMYSRFCLSCDKTVVVTIRAAGDCYKDVVAIGMTCVTMSCGLVIALAGARGGSRLRELRRVFALQNAAATMCTRSPHEQ
eukprot:1195469-Prorocentrum_minimum.AAC.1